MKYDKVVFRYDTDADSIFALFPKIKETDKHYRCYAHIGQHSSCSSWFISSGKKVESSNPMLLPLIKELVGLGYALNCVEMNIKVK